jgi:hypothetical protein
VEAPWMARDTMIITGVVPRKKSIVDMSIIKTLIRNGLLLDA